MKSNIHVQLRSVTLGTAKHNQHDLNLQQTTEIRAKYHPQMIRLPITTVDPFIQPVNLNETILQHL